MASKFFHFDENKLMLINKLFMRQIDNEFVVLQESQTFCDIAQWSSKFKDVHIVTVPRDKLDFRNELSS